MPTEPKTTMCYLLQSDIIIGPLKTLLSATHFIGRFTQIAIFMASYIEVGHFFNPGSNFERSGQFLNTTRQKRLPGVNITILSYNINELVYKSKLLSIL